MTEKPYPASVPVLRDIPRMPTGHGEPLDLGKQRLPLFILAGHNREARRVAEHELGLPPLAWHYVPGIDDHHLMGVSDHWRYLTVGTFWERDDADGCIFATSRTSTA